MKSNSDSLLFWDKHTEYLADEKEKRQERVRQITARGKFIYHPVDIATFRNVVRAAASRNGMLDKIPSNPFPSPGEFLQATVAAFESAGMPPEDVDWVVKTYEDMEAKRMNK